MREILEWTSAHDYQMVAALGDLQWRKATSLEWHGQVSSILAAVVAEQVTRFRAVPVVVEHASRRRIVPMSGALIEQRGPRNGPLATTLDQKTQRAVQTAAIGEVPQ
jgi:hypothetical protein